MVTVHVVSQSNAAAMHPALTDAICGFDMFTSPTLHNTQIHCVRIKSGPQNNYLKFNENLSDLAKILDV